MAQNRRLEGVKMTGEAIENGELKILKFVGLAGAGISNHEEFDTLNAAKLTLLTPVILLMYINLITKES